MTAVTINGNAYSDDGSQSRDMRFGGHQTWLLPMLQDTMTEVDAANNAAISADASAIAAAASATSAANYAAALKGTSATSLSITVASKSLTTQTGKQFAAGQYVLLVDHVTPAQWMLGSVTSYNSGSGALVVNVEDVAGSGTIALWDILVSGKRGAQGLQGIDGAGIPTTTGNAYKHLRVNSAATGAEWVDRPFSNVQIMTSSGTFTPASGVTKHLVILTGGGGGADTDGAGKGGAGGYVFGLMTISTAQTVTIGSAGTSATTATAGGNSSIGSIATANGGAGASGSFAGAGGSASTTDAGCIAVSGQDGGNSTSAVADVLGASFFGARGYGSGGKASYSPQAGVAVFIW